MARRELSPIQLIVLGLLDRDPMHPYELLRVMRKHADDRHVTVSVGSIYHAVERLQRDGLVEAVGTDREGSRPERTTYQATAAGRQAHTERTRELLRTVEREYPAFDVGLGQADALTGPEVAALLRERLDAVRTEHAAYSAAIADLVARGLPRHVLLDVLHEIALREAHIAWLRTTVAEIDDGVLDWDEPVPDHLPDAADLPLPVKEENR